MKLLTLLALILISCGKPQSQEKLRFSSASIWGGTDLNQAETDYHSVAFITSEINNYVGYCSGTLIRPGIVLTAAHCFQGQKIDDYVQNTMIKINKRSYRLKKVTLPSDFTSSEDIAGHLNKLDLMLLWLDQQVTPDVSLPTPLADQTTLNQIHAGDHVIGAGASRVRISQTTTPTYSSLTHGMINRIHKSSTSELGVLAKHDFKIVDSSGSQYFNSEGNMTGGVCQGDSGGPLFIRNKSEQLELVGVLSRGFVTIQTNTPPHQATHDIKCFSQAIHTKGSSLLKFVQNNTNDVSESFRKLAFTTSDTGNLLDKNEFFVNSNELTKGQNYFEIIYNHNGQSLSIIAVMHDLEREFETKKYSQLNETFETNVKLYPHPKHKSMLMNIFGANIWGQMNQTLDAKLFVSPTHMKLYNADFFQQKNRINIYWKR